MFVDETVLMSQARRRSTTEDDNPPSPVGIDTMDSLMSQQVGSNASMGSRRDMVISLIICVNWGYNCVGRSVIFGWVRSLCNCIVR